MRKREPRIFGCIPSGPTRRRTIRGSPRGCFISRISPLSGRCPGWKSGRSRWRKGFPASGPTPPFSPFCCRGSGSGYRRGIPEYPSIGSAAAGEWGKKGCSPQIPLPSLYSYKSVAKGGRSVGAAGLCRADPSLFTRSISPFCQRFWRRDPASRSSCIRRPVPSNAWSRNSLSFPVRRASVLSDCPEGKKRAPQCLRRPFGCRRAATG